MKVHYIDSPNQIVLENAINEILYKEGINAVVVLSCGENLMDLEAFSNFLKGLSKPISGGIFPGIIYEKQVYKRGSLIIEVTKDVYTQIFHHLSDLNDHLEGDLMDFSLKIEDESLLMVYFDGLTQGIESFKESLFYNLGLSHQYVGGGAGTLDFSKTPAIISNEGLLQDAAVIMAMQVPVGIGVAHGWHPITDEIKVSKASRNVIQELNGRNALQVYRDVIFERTGERLDPSLFFQVAQKFPFGIARMNLDMVVRDPISCNENGEIICVGDVPSGSFVHILSGNVRSLVNGAIQAKEAAERHYQLKSQNESMPFLIDCISRFLFLKEDYVEELEAIGMDNLTGVLTLGEIANSGVNYLELYNKTAVVCMMEV